LIEIRLMKIPTIAFALALTSGFVFVEAVAEAIPNRGHHKTTVAQTKHPGKKRPKKPKRLQAAPPPAEVEEPVPTPAPPTPTKPVAPPPSPAPSSDAPLEATAPVDADVAPAPAETSERPKGIGRAFLVAAVGFDLGGRSLSYRDRVTSNLLTYDVLGAPSIGANVEVYPLASSEIQIVRDLGITGGYRQAFSLSSRTETGEQVSTGWSRLDVGLRFRGQVLPNVPLLLGASVGFKREAFTFAGATEIENDMPSVTYSCLKFGGDVRVPLGPIAITAAAGYAPVLSAGAVAGRLRKPTVGAIEAEVGVAVPFGKMFEARIIGNYSRYFYSFKPEFGDIYVAGGALDQLVRGQAAIAFIY
jgi:hypothetical protein